VRFALLNETTSAAPLSGSLTSDYLTHIAEAMTVYLNRDVCTFWGGDATIRVASDVGIGEYAFALLDTLPDAPGAIAYHTVDGHAVPMLLVGVDECATLAELELALSHEMAETMIDPFINCWRAAGDGYLYAQEGCDGVEQRSYTISPSAAVAAVAIGVPDAVVVSDFVLPAFFAPNSVGPYTFCGRMGWQVDATGPFQTMPGGYQIRKSDVGGETQIWGEIHRMPRKRAHWSSRTAKRMRGVGR
jgi:hypothetical protein